MKDKILNLLESAQIRYSTDMEGDCTVCAWNKTSDTVHVCKAINELLNQLDKQISTYE